MIRRLYKLGPAGRSAGLQAALTQALAERDHARDVAAALEAHWATCEEHGYFHARCPKCIWDAEDQPATGSPGNP